MRAPILTALVISALAIPLARAQAPTRGAIGVEALESRLSRLESQLSARSMFELLERLDSLQKELQALRGELEIQAHDIASIKQRQRELFVDLDRLARGSDSVAPAPGMPSSAGVPAAEPAAVVTQASPPPAAPAGANPSVTPPATLAGAAPAAPGIDSFEEQNAYQEAFTLLKEGRYEKAAESFQAFMATYPAGKYADNAQYWLAEAYYVTRDFPRAMDEFQTLVRAYPESAKLPGAQLKIGFIHHELGALAEARKVLGELIERYPTSTAARLARDRLKRLPAS